MLSDNLLLLAQPVCCALSVMQVPCYDVYGYPTLLVGLRGVGDTSPARGRPNTYSCLHAYHVSLHPVLIYDNLPVLMVYTSGTLPHTHAPLDC
jgi:hypothetical protein